jgi:hypothetical protein
MIAELWTGKMKRTSRPQYPSTLVAISGLMITLTLMGEQRVHRGQLGPSYALKPIL